MATIDLATKLGSGFHPSNWAGGVKTPYLVEVEIDLAAAATAKGSALAVTDVIEAIDVPAGTAILNAGIQKVTAMTGTSTDVTLNVGITGISANAYVNGYDLDAGAVGSYSVNGAQTLIVPSVNDTIDILIATQSGTVTGGKVRVFAVLQDVKAKLASGLAQIGS